MYHCTIYLVSWCIIVHFPLLFIIRGSDRALNQVKPNHSLFCFVFVIYYLWKWSCPQVLNQVKPNHFPFIALFFCRFTIRGSGRALNQVKPNHFPFLLHLLLFRSGRALNQVKPNHFSLFLLYFFFVILLRYLETNYFFDQQVILFYNNRWRQGYSYYLEVHEEAILLIPAHWKDCWILKF